MNGKTARVIRKLSAVHFADLKRSSGKEFPADAPRRHYKLLKHMYYLSGWKAFGYRTRRMALEALKLHTARTEKDAVA